MCARHGGEKRFTVVGAELEKINVEYLVTEK